MQEACNEMGTSLRGSKVHLDSKLHKFALQIRKISVKRVVSPILFDNLKNAVIGGLYDPAMGPMDTREK